VSQTEVFGLVRCSLTAPRARHGLLVQSPVRRAREISPRVVPAIAAEVRSVNFDLKLCQADIGQSPRMLSRRRQETLLLRWLLLVQHSAETSLRVGSPRSETDVCFLPRRHFSLRRLHLFHREESSAD